MSGCENTLHSKKASAKWTAAGAQNHSLLGGYSQWPMKTFLSFLYKDKIRDEWLIWKNQESAHFGMLQYLYMQMCELEMTRVQFSFD